MQDEDYETDDEEELGEGYESERTSRLRVRTLWIEQFARMKGRREADALMYPVVGLLLVSFVALCLGASWWVYAAGLVCAVTARVVMVRRLRRIWREQLTWLQVHYALETLVPSVGSER